MTPSHRKERAKMDKEQYQKAYAKIIAKAWADDGFKQRLLCDPAPVLKENGIEAHEGVEFKVLESTSNLIHLVLPARPDPSEVSEEDLENRAAAIAVLTCCAF